PDVSLIGKSGVAGDVRVNLLAPNSQLRAYERPVEPGGHDLGHQLVDLRASAVDDCAQPANLLVEFEHAGKLVDDRLRAWNVRERAAQRRKEAGTCLLTRQERRRRMWIYVDETAIDLAKRRPAVDCRDRFLKRAVVEHRAVEKRYQCRVDAGAQMVGERFRDEFRAP